MAKAPSSSRKVNSEDSELSELENALQVLERLKSSDVVSRVIEREQTKLDEIKERKRIALDGVEDSFRDEIEEQAAKVTEYRKKFGAVAPKATSVGPMREGTKVEVDELVEAIITGLDGKGWMTARSIKKLPSMRNLSEKIKSRWGLAIEALKNEKKIEVRGDKAGTEYRTPNSTGGQARLSM